MQQLHSLYLAKAEESLMGAESEFINGRFNNCANRCYYSVFQAAIHALQAAGVTLQAGRSIWSHDFVQAQFAGQLIGRRKLYPSSLSDTLARNLILRHTGDYSVEQVSRTQASRALHRTRALYAAIRDKGGESA